MKDMVFAIATYRSLVVAVFAAIATTAAANTWYVSESGSGSMNGTSATNAWPITAFNSGTHWSGAAGTAGKISPGDTVHVLGAITSSMSCAGSGAAGQIVTVEFESGSTMANRFFFNGKDYIRMTGMHMIDNYGTGAGSPIVTFGTSSSTLSSYCQVDHMYSYGKKGSAFVQVGYCSNVTVSDCTFVNFSGMGMTMSNRPCDRITIQNNIFETVKQLPAGSGQTDLLHLAWATNVLIKGNRLIMKGSVPAGTLQADLPHNDIIQCYYNFSDKTQRPTNWTIANNWCEIDGPQNGSGYNNFGMLQWMSGTWVFSGNVFYSHDMSSSVSNGIDFEVRAANAGVIAKFHDNTFVSVRNGLGLCLLAIPNSSGADRDRLELINNIFYSDQTGVPILQGISTEPNGVLVMNRNVIVGWGSAIKNYSPSGALVSTTGLNTTWGLGGRKSTASEVALLSTTRGSENFLVGSSSIVRQNGAEPSTPLTLPKVQSETAFPGPPTGSTGTVVDIGAAIQGVTIAPPTNLQIVQ
jgi:hypothetical protein